MFGGRLAKALSDDERFRVIVAGRDEVAAKQFCEGTKCHALVLDRNEANLEEKIREQAPYIIIDAAGPFQNYGEQPYRLVSIALDCGAHYLDLSDDAQFTDEIRRYDAAAKSAGLVVLSGVSSVPALSSTVVSELSQDIEDIHLIESVILPGNRAPRGLSVVEAILSQVGRPVPVWRDGGYVGLSGWGGVTSVSMKDSASGARIQRWASVIGAPDLQLFPEHFRARNVIFRAGLDLKLMHGGLWLLSWLVRFRLIKSLSPFARVLKAAADSVERFGSDVGGMAVSVSGIDKAGMGVRKRWELFVRDGDGPSIPTIAAQILCQKILSGEVDHGARPCLEEFTLREADAVLARLAVTTAKFEAPIPLAFRSILEGEFECLPSELRDLHTVIDVRNWSGRACIQRGEGALSRLAGWIVGFPAAAEDIPVSVNMRKTARGEIWTRTFGTKRFRSNLSVGSRNGLPCLLERFGVMCFSIALVVKDGVLRYPVKSGRVFGVPLPKLFLPVSETREFVDEEGRACFDVKISLPFVGHVVTYAGWLMPVNK